MVVLIWVWVFVVGRVTRVEVLVWVWGFVVGIVTRVEVASFRARWVLCRGASGLISVTAGNVVVRRGAFS